MTKQRAFFVGNFEKSSMKQWRIRDHSKLPVKRNSTALECRINGFWFRVTSHFKQNIEQLAHLNAHDLFRFTSEQQEIRL